MADSKTSGPMLDEVMAELTPNQRRRVRTRTAELVEEERSLRELRKALGLTQVDVARRLGKGQETISRIEQRGDLLLSTLNDYVASLGGELELLCRFKDGTAVRVATEQFASAERAAKPKMARRARAVASQARSVNT